MDEPATTTELVRQTDLDQLARIGTWLALSESGSDTEKAKGAAAALRLYYAQELGLPPLAAAELSVIKGRLFLSAQLLRALALRHGYEIEKLESSDESCTVVLRHHGSEVGTSTYTIDDAKKAGIIRNGSAWQTHPARMLWARASKNVIVDYAPQIALGISLDDEVQEFTGQAPTGPVEDALEGDLIDEEEIPWPAGDEYDTAKD